MNLIMISPNHEINVLFQQLKILLPWADTDVDSDYFMWAIFSRFQAILVLVVIHLYRRI